MRVRVGTVPGVGDVDHILDEFLGRVRQPRQRHHEHHRCGEAQQAEQGSMGERAGHGKSHSIVAPYQGTAGNRANDAITMLTDSRRCFWTHGHPYP